MRKLMACAACAGVGAWVVMAPAAAFAGTSGTPTPSASASGAANGQSVTNAPPLASGDPNTTVTFAVSVGELTMTAPGSVNLGTGSGAPGTTVSGVMGDTVVTDDRAELSASWTATAASSDFTTGTDTPAETIPATDATYNPGTITTTGTITPTGFPITLSNGAQTVVTGSDGVGDNTATWDAALAVHLPAAAVGGDYTGTLTQSVA